MKRFTKWLSVCCLLISGAFSTTSFAASQDECAIWICAPGGFPAGCGGAFSAMVDRVKDFKPPLPPFPSCLVSSSGVGAPTSNMDSNYGAAAFIPAHTECVREVDYYNGMRCAEYRNVPQQYVRGRSCITHHESGVREPKGCTRTVNYVEVFIDGELAGPTYYW